MCQIVAYAGGRSALDAVLDGLRQPADAGHAVAGVAVLADGGLAVARKAGTLEDLRSELVRHPLPAGTAALGHLCRAAHPPAADADAQPRLDSAGRVAVVQHGVLTDAGELRAELAAQGASPAPASDAGIVAQLLAQDCSSSGALAEAVRGLCGRLTGSFALAAVHADEPGTVVAVHRGLPLLVGAGDGEAYCASGPGALPDGLPEVLDPGRDRVAEIRRDSVALTHLDGTPAQAREVWGGGRA